MRWVRLCKRPAALAGLLALLLQLVLPFGHIDLERAGHAGATQTSTAAAAHGGGATTPSHDRDDDEFCARCAIAALLASAQSASAPILPIPFIPTSAKVPLDLNRAPIIAPRSAFQSRAPPLA